MKMKIEQLWAALESESAATSSKAWLMRQVLPEAGFPLYIAIEAVTRTRVLLMPVPKEAVPPRREWPVCRGLEISRVQSGTSSELAVRLKDKGAREVFSVLAQDIAARVIKATSPQEAVSQLFGRLRCWQQLLSTMKDTLSLEAQRGLWGELHVLRAMILPEIGPANAVNSWKAPYSAHQDFQVPQGAIEVKTTTSKQPQNVRITSERQLDSTGIATLLLHVVIVDERDVAGQPLKQGLTLPDMVDALRSQLATDPVALTNFNDRLLQAGWIDAKAASYDNRRWAVRKEMTFQVKGGFPRLVELELPSGIGDVNYALNLAACRKFTVTTEASFKRLLTNRWERRKGKT